VTNTYEKIRGEVVAGGALGEEDPVAGGPRAVLGLSAIGLLLLLLLLVAPWAFVFVIGLLISIFLHETGHFVAARKSGMKVTQFFMGMGPKLWSFRRGEIEYGVRALPIGAFVRIIGMNNLDETAPEDEPRAYRNMSYPRRMITICAGSIMHMLIAIVLIFGVYAVAGKGQAGDRYILGSVSARTPASSTVVTTQPGILNPLEAGDRIISIAGSTPTSSKDMANIIKSHQVGEKIDIVVERDGEILDLTATLDARPEGDDDAGKAFLGVTSGFQTVFVKHSLGWTVVHSFTDLGTVTWKSVGGVVKVLNPVNIWGHVTGSNTDQTTQPTTVYGISKFSSTIGEETGLSGILLTLAAVNVFIGLLNLFPLLPFDGGHAAIATYERIRSRKGKAPYRADVGKMVPVAMAVMTFLVFLLSAGLFLDITRPLK